MADSVDRYSLPEFGEMLAIDSYLESIMIGEYYNLEAFIDTKWKERPVAFFRPPSSVFKRVSYYSGRWCKHWTKMESYIISRIN